MKRYTNRLVAGLLVLLMLVAALPVTAFAETTETKNESAAEERVTAAPNEQAVKTTDAGDLDISDPIVPTPVRGFDPAVGRDVYIRVSRIEDSVQFGGTFMFWNAPGFQLALYDAQQNLVMTSQTTLHPTYRVRMCKLSGVKPGNYTLKIVKAPRGYENYDITKSYQFTVDQSGDARLEIYQKEGYNLACGSGGACSTEPSQNGIKTPFLILLGRKSKAKKEIVSSPANTQKLVVGKGDVITYKITKPIYPDHNTVVYFYSRTMISSNIGAYVDQSFSDDLSNHLKFQEGSLQVKLDGVNTNEFEGSYDQTNHRIVVKDKSNVYLYGADLTDTMKMFDTVYNQPTKTLEVTFKVKVKEANGSIFNTVDDSTTELIPFKVKVKVNKIWQDNDDQAGKRPTSVTIVLKGDGVEKDRHTVTEGDNWEWTFTGLPKKNDAGNDIVYTVEELPVDGYKTKTTGDATRGFTVTNTLKPTVEVTAKKVWVGDANRTDARPASIEFILKADGVEKERHTVTEGNHWTWTFRNLPKENDDGNDIVYTIEEVPVEGYKTTIAGDAKNGFTVTNRLIPPPPTTHPKEIAIPVEKVWEDDGNRENLRPTSITVRLYADGKDTGKSVVLTETNDWKGQFLHLPEFNAGKKIVYTIEEERVAHYDSSVSGNQTDGFTVTNRVEEPPKPPTPPTPPTPHIPPTPPVIIVPRIPRAGVGA